MKRRKSRKLKVLAARERRTAESFGLRMARLMPWTIRRRADDTAASLGRLKKPRAKLAALRKLAAYLRKLNEDAAAASYELQAAAIQASLPDVVKEERASAQQRRVERMRWLLRNWERKLKLAKTKIRRLRSSLRRYNA